MTGLPNANDYFTLSVKKKKKKSMNLFTIHTAFFLSLLKVLNVVISSTEVLGKNIDIF